MKDGPSDPNDNVFQSGLRESDVRNAIERSGYPLQLRVATALANDFQITEEWAYRDRFTGAVRTLDLVGERRLEVAGESGQIALGVRLLIECKRSDLPYVFFKGAANSPVREFPHIHGVSARRVRLFTASHASDYPIARVLGFEHEPFTSAAPTCAIFSKIVLDKKRLSLSGSEPYHDIVLPLVSSVADAENRYRPKESRLALPTVTLAICVLEAPMIMVDVTSDEYTYQPWVRVVRHDVSPHIDGRSDFHPTYVVDIVRADFFATFLTSHVSPFVEVFRHRVARNPKLLREMTGVVSNLEYWSWEDVRDP